MADFSPVQLDALEDALEDLELAGIPPEFEHDDAVAGRLSEYRGLLQLSREALPPVEVPLGVLDAVLAAARDEASLASVAGSASPSSAGPAASESPWWKRLSVWIPVLAVGASAALVLVMVQGTLSHDEPAADAVARADKAEPAAASKDGTLLERSDALQAAAEPLAAGDTEEHGKLGLGVPESRGRLRGSAAVDRDADDLAPVADHTNADGREVQAQEEADAEEAPAPAEPTDKVIYEKDKGVAPEPAKARKPSNSSSGSKKTPPTTPAPAPEQKPRPKAEPDAKAEGKVPGSGAAGGSAAPDPDGALTAADTSRRNGSCSTARTTYRRLVDHREAKIRARALAGLGLCALSEGDDKGAEAYFSRARKADSTIGGFISRERDESGEQTQQAL